jgi:L-2-hydroxyglutarate oxidase LhgO
MAATEDDIVDEFFKTIGTIQSMKNNLDIVYYNGIKEILEDAKKKVSAHTGIYLHDLDNTKPDQETLQKMIPSLEMDDIQPARAGVRAQAVDSTGFLLDDFSIIQTARGIHVQNAPSPAATSSLSIGKYIVGLAESSFSL